MQKLLKKNTILLIENYADNIHYSINDYVFIALDQCYSDKCGKTISDIQLSYVTNSVSSSQKIDFTDYLFCMFHLKNVGF